MAKAKKEDAASDFPEILSTLLELVRHHDDDLSWEASLALRFFLERECISGDALWLSDVEAFLTLKDNLAAAVGSPSVKGLRISPKERDDLAYQVFRRIELKATNAWRYAYILKRATCVAGLQDDVADYLQDNWGNDEQVTLHLLNVIWEVEKPSNFHATLRDISQNAASEQLRDTAARTLRVAQELDDVEPPSLDK